VKALLPIWSVVLLAAGAALAGAAVVDAGAPWWAGAAVAFALGPGVVSVLRRVLPRFGARGYDELPDSFFGLRRSRHELLSDLLNQLAPIVAGVAAGLPALALGIGTEAAVLGLPAWLVCGALTGWPVYTELDARLAVRFDRENAEEEDALLAAAEAEAPAIGTGTVEIPLDRGFLAFTVAWMLAVAAALVAVAVLVDDAPVVRVLAGACVPFVLWAAARTARDLRAPYFARLDEHGIDVLGRGAIPWSDVRGVELRSLHSTRRLFVECREHPGADAPIRAAGWTPERVLGALRSHGVEHLDVALA
jgi:hypothetical protein